MQIGPTRADSNGRVKNDEIQVGSKAPLTASH